MADPLSLGQEAFRCRAWADAYANLSRTDHETPLEVEDLECLATAAYLIGRDGESAEAWARAHHQCLRHGETARAVRCAFWLGFQLLLKGEDAPAGGWFARAQRLLDDDPAERVEQGFLLVPAARRSLLEGDAAGGYPLSSRVVEIGCRFGDRDLMALGRNFQGYALILMEKITEGVAALDEAMASVTAGEVSPTFAGLIYCIMIETCQDIFDFRRAREWTVALTRWCESQPDLVPYRGQCLVHRAEIMQLRGAWPDAIEETRRARERLSDPPGQAAIGMAHYQAGELSRLRGEFAAAEAAYRQASRCGRTPQPGLALLRLAQGRVDAADAAIRTALDGAQGRAARAKLLAAYVEIVLAAGDVGAARGAAEELSDIAAHFRAPFLHAAAAHAMGSVQLAEGDARAACTALRASWKAWHELEVPYEAARVRVLSGLAYRRLGDADTAEMELDAARWVFRELGAAPDLARAEALSEVAPPRAAGRLTVREVEVLRLVAAGKSNRAIAADLVISEHTVARHIQNIFTKLDVASRTAAAAFAFEQDLL